MDKCKDCIHNNVCNRDAGYGWLECPHFINSADVISRAEATRLQSQVNRLKKYDEERDIALHAQLIANTRQEVASEVFEEIEFLLKIVKIPCVNEEGCVTPLRAGYWAIDPNDYNELKKKCTEGK